MALSMSSFTDALTPEALERKKQAEWRRWDTYLDCIEQHLKSNSPEMTPGENQQGKINENTRRKIQAHDFGCGTGEVCLFMARRGWNAVGLDASKEMLDTARQTAAAANLPIDSPLTKQQREKQNNLSFHAADVTQLDLSTIKEHSLNFPTDLIWSSFSIQYFFPAFKERILSHWVNHCLKLGGILAIVETNGLFSAHQPMPETTTRAFYNMERSLRDDFGYDCAVGSKLKGTLMEHAERLSIVAHHEMEDEEFSFQGPASQTILEAWRGRCQRMKYPKQFFGTQQWEKYKQDFLSCLASPEHTCSTRLTFILAQKIR